MMLRRMTLWRKTDPKTGTPTLCEPAESKRMSRFHKRNFYTEIHSQNAAPQNRGADLLRRLGSRNACQDFTRATLYINLQEKCRAPKPRRTLCASLRGRNALQHVKNHFLLKFTGKMPCTRLSPERGHTFCASLHNRNALQHFIRATLYRNLQEKCRGPKPRLTLCASLRSRNACRMSRFHESNFIQKNAGKMRKTRVSTLIKHRPLHLP